MLPALVFSVVGRSATEGSEIVEIQNAGAERGHVPGAVPGATTCPRSDREEIGHRGLRDHRV